MSYVTYAKKGGVWLRGRATERNWRRIRDLNPWPPAWQAGVLLFWTNTPHIGGREGTWTLDLVVNSHLLPASWATHPYQSDMPRRGLFRNNASIFGYQIFWYTEVITNPHLLAAVHILTCYWWPPHRISNCRSTFFIFRVLCWCLPLDSNQLSMTYEAIAYPYKLHRQIIGIDYPVQLPKTFARRKL